MVILRVKGENKMKKGEKKPPFYQARSFEKPVSSPENHLITNYDGIDVEISGAQIRGPPQQPRTSIRLYQLVSCVLGSDTGLQART